MSLFLKKNLLRSKVSQLLRWSDGATAIEYALIAGAIALGIIAVAFLIGDTVGDMFTNVSDDINANL